jgi:hypothetical protein
MKRLVVVSALIGVTIVAATWALGLTRTRTPKPHVVDGVIYGHADERLVLTVRAIDAGGKAEELASDLQPGCAFSDISQAGTARYGLGGWCRPMVSGEYMLQFDLYRSTEESRHDPSQLVQWKGPVTLGEAYPIDAADGRTVTVILSKKMG